VGSLLAVVDRELAELVGVEYAGRRLVIPMPLGCRVEAYEALIPNLPSGGGAEVRKP